MKIPPSTQCRGLTWHPAWSEIGVPHIEGWKCLDFWDAWRGRQRIGEPRKHKEIDKESCFLNKGVRKPASAVGDCISHDRTFDSCGNSALKKARNVEESESQLARIGLRLFGSQWGPLLDPHVPPGVWGRRCVGEYLNRKPPWLEAVCVLQVTPAQVSLPDRSGKVVLGISSFSKEKLAKIFKARIRRKLQSSRPARFSGGEFSVVHYHTSSSRLISPQSAQETMLNGDHFQKNWSQPFYIRRHPWGKIMTPSLALTKTKSIPWCELFLGRFIR